MAHVKAVATAGHPMVEHHPDGTLALCHRAEITDHGDGHFTVTSEDHGTTVVYSAESTWPDASGEHVHSVRAAMESHLRGAERPVASKRASGPHRDSR